MTTLPESERWKLAILEGERVAQEVKELNERIAARRRNKDTLTDHFCRLPDRRPLLTAPVVGGGVVVEGEF